MIKRKILLGFLIFVVWSDYIFSQEIEEAKDDVIIGLTPNTQLALSTPDYLVTPGDVYTLAYLAGGTALEYSIVVDSSYRIRISNLGTINATGKTFSQLKTQVESVVINNYPLGGPQFVLKQPGTFRVYLKGEVQTTKEISTWALARLSTLLQNNLTNYSSIRNVTIKPLNGQAKVYDLFKANRFGDLSQNPYVRPEDTIIVSRVERRVTIAGAVERPGTYQLLAGENLKELIEVYAGAFTPLADKTCISLVRFMDCIDNWGDIYLLSEEDVQGNYNLLDYDVITVSVKASRATYYP